MDFVKGKLDASHEDHDTFIYEYMKKDERDAVDDVVLEALEAELEARDETELLRTWVKRRLPLKRKQDFHFVHRMALYIMLTQYSTQWPGMFEATYNLLMDMLRRILEGNKRLIFPPKWTRQVFRLENCLRPADIKGVMWGIDPIPSSSGYGKYATGYAFTFAVPDDLTTEAPSSKGLKEVYGLDISLNQDKTVEEQFVKEYGIGLVNFIRTIKANSTAGSGNDFKYSWIPYNLEWLKVLNITLKDKVMVFQNFKHPFNNYCPNNSDFNELKLLISEKRWPHPSYIKKNEKMDHCLKSPVVSCYSTCGACKPERCNARVNGFVLFLEVLEAGYAVRCGGNNCNCTATRTALEEILFCHFTSDFY